MGIPPPGALKLQHPVLYNASFRDDDVPIRYPLDSGKLGEIEHWFAIREDEPQHSKAMGRLMQQEKAPS